MHSILKKIIEEKKKQLKNVTPESFKKTIVQSKGVALIGEIKLASPTHPFLGSLKDVEKKVRAYEKAGVDALSVITEKNFFKGDSALIPKIKQMTSSPILQKDFVIDEYQLYEAKFLGSDAMLLIARILSQKTLQKFVLLAHTLGVEPVVEVASKEDLKKALYTATKIIAVNARDLDSFQVDIKKAISLMDLIPKKIIRLGFSGVVSAREFHQYESVGAKGVLIGTSLMQTNNEAEFIRSLHV